jgi:hypothetical protein
VTPEEFTARAKALAGMTRKDSHEVHALVSHLIEDGMTKTDAIHAVAEEIDSSAQSVSAAYYRVQRRQNGVGPNREDSVARAADSAIAIIEGEESEERWAEFHAFIDKIVEREVQKRLEAARKALG